MGRRWQQCALPALLTLRRERTHQSRPPLLWSLGWLFHTAAKPMVTGSAEAYKRRDVELSMDDVGRLHCGAFNASTLLHSCVNGRAVRLLLLAVLGLEQGRCVAAECHG